MNLNSMSTPMMIHLTGVWSSNPGFRAALTAIGPLGVGVLAELDAAHDPLLDITNNRISNRVQLRELVERAAELDVRHRRKARAVYGLLRGLIDAADDDATAAELEALLALLFPIGLKVTKLSHLEVAGAAAELGVAVKPAVRAKLAAITIGDHTLAQLVDEWIAAAKELGRTVMQRFDRIAETGRDGTGGRAFDMQAARTQWIRTVRALLWVLDSKPELAQVRESVHAGLAGSIAIVQRRASGAALGEGEGEAVEELEARELDPDDLISMADSDDVHNPSDGFAESDVEDVVIPDGDAGEGDETG